MLFNVGISRRSAWIADGPVNIAIGVGKIKNLCGNSNFSAVPAQTIAASD